MISKFINNIIIKNNKIIINLSPLNFKNFKKHLTFTDLYSNGHPVRNATVPEVTEKVVCF